MAKEWISATEVAELLGVQSNTLAKWRARGTGPAFRKAGFFVVYDLEEVLRWRDAHDYHVSFEVAMAAA